ncbi:hypothetical protein KP509_15G000400 [Ceratopteris richardii]|uniref:Uncharacterized protein n=1 Tax=Ceratopteris richardii TaxID=49495 RepID=A0A8T2T2F1_CERRI|nr:hypothetical protein KP509_15G000400 [Ceratopteris richardii]
MKSHTTSQHPSSILSPSPLWNLLITSPKSSMRSPSMRNLTTHPNLCFSPIPMSPNRIMTSPKRPTCHPPLPHTLLHHQTHINLNPIHHLLRLHTPRTLPLHPHTPLRLHPHPSIHRVPLHPHTPHRLHPHVRRLHLHPHTRLLPHPQTHLHPHLHRVPLHPHTRLHPRLFPVPLRLHTRLHPHLFRAPLRLRTRLHHLEAIPLPLTSSTFFRAQPMENDFITSYYHPFNASQNA